MNQEIKIKALNQLKKQIENWIDEDKIFSDITTKTLQLNGEGVITFFSKNKNDFIVAGIDFVSFIFNYVSKLKKTKFKIFPLKRDGDIVSENQKILNIVGNLPFLFSFERLSLNLLARLSGIASETRKMADICSRYGVEFCATRKTTPGLRYLEKYAVMIGGGATHRLNLQDGILIKDNHIETIGGSKALLYFFIKNKNKLQKISKPIEIEVQKEEDLTYALSICEIIGKATIMLDNISKDKIPTLISKIRQFSSDKKIDIKIEISGGIRPSNIEDYAKLKPDRISAGYITLSPQVPDISADIKSI